jgi:ParB/RepB/Spo0J family partition protein
MRDPNEGLPLLTKELLLEALSGAEVGASVLGGQGTLLRLPPLEGRKFRIPIGMITPNPTQPRTRFDDGKLKELAGSIKEVGQLVAGQVIPFSDGDSVGLYLEDGERRLRACELNGVNYFVAEIVWDPDENRIFEKSFILNIQREGHTPIEIAKALKRMVDGVVRTGTGDEGKPAEEIVSGRTGFPVNKIKGYLEFLRFPEEVQDLLHTGALKPAHVMRLLGKRGGSGPERTKDERRAARLALAAREILDYVEGRRAELEGAETDDGDDGEIRITVDDVARIKRRVERFEVGPEESIRLEIADAILTCRRAAWMVTRRAEILTSTGSKPVAVEAMRNMGEGKPPELLRDLFQTLALVALELVDVAEEAVKPPKLEVPAGKPSFVDYVRSCERKFNGIRFGMAHLIAHASDNKGSITTTPELARQLCTQDSTINGNIALLRAELGAIGLVLEVHDARVKDNRNHYAKVNGYRLNWKKTDEPGAEVSEKIQTKVEAPENLRPAGDRIASLLVTSYEHQIKSLGMRNTASLGGALVVRLRAVGEGNRFVVSTNIKTFAMNFGASLAELSQIICESLGVSSVTIQLEEIFR